MTTKTIQVEPVDGRRVLDPDTRVQITKPCTVRVTPFYTRRIRCGDLVEVKPAPADSEVKPAKGKKGKK